MSLYDDFRASVHPATAARRKAYFGELLIAAKARETLNEASGLGNASYGSPDYELTRLLQAQVSFANSQIAKATPPAFESKGDPGKLEAERSVTGSRAPVDEARFDPSRFTVKASEVDNIPVASDAAIDQQRLRLECLRLAVGEDDQLDVIAVAKKYVDYILNETRSDV